MSLLEELEFLKGDDSVASGDFQIKLVKKVASVVEESHPLDKL
jgi:hypothetical protein